MTDARRGFALGVPGVVVFAMTLPMTRLAVGDASDPRLPPAFVTAGRAAVAGLPIALYLLAARAPPPVQQQRPSAGFRACAVLGERLEPLTVLFSLAVSAVVFLGRRMPVRRSAK